MSDSEFRDQSVIVTGAARGLGRGIAEAFAREGANVLICDINAEQVARTASELAVSTGSFVDAIPADVSSSADMSTVADRALSQFGRIDHLVNNAGIVTIAPFLDTPESDFDRIMAVNLKGVFLGMRAVLPHMLERKSGSIVNIASQAGKRPNAFIAPYNASKAGVISLTRTVAVEAAPYVRVNCVAPGFINTELQEEEYDVVSALTGRPRDEIKQSWIDSMPLKRFQEVEDVAKAVLFLSSSAASQTTGEALNISGGLVME